MSGLTATEIASLMEQARKAGASSFKYGDLEVEFESKENSLPDEKVDPKTGLTASEAKEWFASSEG